nr:Chain D, Histone-lysine N-methyltransferase MLL4 [Homo sapiens]4ERZ_E Chain E, Histone-lysine N-methyltransferase MLL4 [Homo sapiens]4ERZ_F Chain F, Histone-lysine N-methyltransferase MLL4 [Homo sapiens]
LNPHGAARAEVYLR